MRDPPRSPRGPSPRSAEPRGARDPSREPPTTRRPSHDHSARRPSHGSASVTSPSPAAARRTKWRNALIFGDSWADCQNSWPQRWARSASLEVSCFAAGGSTSADLEAQAELFDELARYQPLRGPTLAVIHIGGNDFQHALARGKVRALCAVALAFLQTFLWCFLRLCTAPFYFLGARPAGQAVRRAWAPLSGCTVQDEGENASFTPEVIISRVEALTEELYEKHGVQLFIVAGLPVTGCLPLVQLLMQSIRKFCLKHVALSLIWLWGRCGADQWQAMCLDLERSLPGCKAIFFDQAAALERVAGKNRGDALGETGGFWMDVLHPTAFGHSLIEADFKLLWQAIEAQHEMPGPSRPTGMGRGAQAAPRKAAASGRVPRGP